MAIKQNITSARKDVEGSLKIYIIILGCLPGILGNWADGYTKGVLLETFGAKHYWATPAELGGLQCWLLTGKIF